MLRRFATLFILTGLLLAGSLGAETVVEHSNETRFQLDLKVPDAALAEFIPAGWTVTPAAQGPAKDCNLRVIFIDRVTINAPDGAAKGSNRYVLLAVPARSPAGENVQLVIGGLTEKMDEVTRPFGNFLTATRHAMERETLSEGGGPIIETQEWEFEAATGERLEMEITYERGVANRRSLSDVKYYSAAKPEFYHISRQELVLDIMRNVTTTPPDHVMEFSFSGSGGKYEKLFDDTVQVLSWDNVLWLNREIVLP